MNERMGRRLMQLQLPADWTLSGVFSVEIAHGKGKLLNRLSGKASEIELPWGQVAIEKNYSVANASLVEVGGLGRMSCLVALGAAAYGLESASLHAEVPRRALALGAGASSVSSSAHPQTPTKQMRLALAAPASASQETTSAASDVCGPSDAAPMAPPGVPAQLMSSELGAVPPQDAEGEEDPFGGQGSGSAAHSSAPPKEEEVARAAFDQA